MCTEPHKTITKPDAWLWKKKGWRQRNERQEAAGIPGGEAGALPVNNMVHSGHYVRRWGGGHGRGVAV